MRARQRRWAHEVLPQHRAEVDKFVPVHAQVACEQRQTAKRSLGAHVLYRRSAQRQRIGVANIHHKSPSECSHT